LFSYFSCLLQFKYPVPKIENVKDDEEIKVEHNDILSANECDEFVHAKSRRVINNQNQSTSSTYEKSPKIM